MAAGKRRNVVVRFSVVREYRKRRKGMGEGFTEFRGGAGAWTQESRVVADTTSWGKLFHSAIVWEKLHLPVLRTVVEKVIPDVMGLSSVCFSWTG